MADISLTAGIRSSLNSLQSTQRLLDTTTNRLATGKKVASAVDNPTNYFSAQNYNDRADGLSARLDGMGEAIQQVKAADNGITAIRGFLSQMKGVVNDAMSNSSASERGELGKQFNELIQQIGTIATDSKYGGINLLKGDSRTVEFNEKIGESTLDIDGFSVNNGATAADGGIGAASTATAGDEASGYAFALKDADGTFIKDGGIKGSSTDTAATAYAVSWEGTGADDAAKFANSKTALTDVVGQIEKVESNLKTQASKLATNLAVITQREDFTNSQIQVLEEGADNLTLADLNEEGANLLALQTSSQLGVQSLSLASQQSQQVLRIIG